MKTAKKINLQNFTDEDLKGIIRSTKKQKGMLKCPLCREMFKPRKHNQIFNTPSCRIRYWKLEKELGVLETKQRLDYLEATGELSFKEKDPT